jgi:metal-sulfur cluster biosynthetic enzyme
MNKKAVIKKTTKKIAEEALKDVIDPELGVNIVDLGLVYSVTLRKDKIYLKMTLTFPGCPLAGPITREAKEVLKALPGIKKAKVSLVWDPPWTPDMVNKDIKDELGL